MSGWGRSAATIRVAEERFRLVGLSPAQAELVASRYRGGETPSKPCDGIRSPAPIEVLVGRGLVPVPAPSRFQVDGNYVPEIDHRSGGIELRGHGFAGTIELQDRLRGSLVTADERLTVEPIILQNYLRVVTAYSALAHGGLLLHCSAAVAGGRAMLFLGRSGAGKTTVARGALAAGAEVLSDDMALVRPRGEGFEVGCVPFVGELGETCRDYEASYPVGGVLWLEQAETLRLSPLSPARQTAHLLSCCPFVNHDPLRAHALQEIVERFLERHPISALELRRGQPWNEVLAVLEAAK